MTNSNNKSKYKISDDEYLWSKVLGNDRFAAKGTGKFQIIDGTGCLLYTSPSPRDKRQSRMPSSA